MWRKENISCVCRSNYCTIDSLGFVAHIFMDSFCSFRVTELCVDTPDCIPERRRLNLSRSVSDIVIQRSVNVFSTQPYFPTLGEILSSSCLTGIFLLFNDQISLFGVVHPGLVSVGVVYRVLPFVCHDCVNCQLQTC